MLIVVFNIHSFLKKINKLLPVFDPGSNLYLIWEFIIFLFTVFNFIYIPFDYSFHYISSQTNNLYFFKICPSIFFTDIIIRMNTCFFERGYLIEDRVLIVKKYIFGYFIIDFISSICLLYRFIGLNYTYMFFFIRMVNFTKIIDKISESIMLNIRLSGIFSLLILLT